MYAPSKKFGMVKTKKYRNWLEKNIPIVKNGLDKPDRYPVEIEITVMEGREFHSRNDIDNVNKAILDILVKAEIIPDDNVKYVISCKEKFMPFPSHKVEAMTLIKYIEPDEEEAFY